METDDALRTAAYRKTIELARRTPCKGATLAPMVLFDPDSPGLVRHVTGAERAYRELMHRAPPPDHPSGQFRWSPKGRAGSPERMRYTQESAAGE